MKTKSGKKIPPGRIHAVSVSDRKGVVKHNVDQAQLMVDHGLAGDAHAEGPGVYRGCGRAGLGPVALGLRREVPALPLGRWHVKKCLC